MEAHSWRRFVRFVAWHKEFCCSADCFRAASTKITHRSLEATAAGEEEEAATVLLLPWNGLMIRQNKKEEASELRELCAAFSALSHQPPSPLEQFSCAQRRAKQKSDKN